MLPVGPRFYNSPLYMREDPYWDKVVLAMHMDGDPYWANTVLSMPMDGADNGTTFTDLKGKTVTPNGNVVTKTNVKAFGTASAYFDGSGDFLTVPTSTDFNFGSGDFTIECWVQPSKTPTTWAAVCGVWTGSTNRQIMLYLAPTGVELYISLNGSSYTSIINVTANISITNFTHLAVTRSTTTIYLFINGVVVGTYNISSTSLPASTAPFLIGAAHTDGVEPFNGYIDGLRVTKGVARYTNHFELSTSPFPIGTTIVDEKSHTITVGGNTTLSSAQSKFGGYSAYFDGSGDYLSIPDSNDWWFGAGDFTIECYVMLNTVHAAYHYLVGQWNGTGLYGWEVVANTNAFVFGYTADGSTGSFVAWNTPTLNLNTWYHLAVSRRGNTIYLFVDGIVSQTATVTVALANVATALFVGMNQNGGAWASNIYMDDLRITKGVGRYISNFNPPPRFSSYVLSDPYTSSVVLDLPFDGAANSTTIIDNKGKTVTAVGNAKLSTTQARVGPTSCYFDGASDYLSIATSTDFNLAANNFTIEFWLYLPTALTYTQMVVGTWDGSSTLNWGVFASINNSIGMSYSTTGIYQVANDIGVNNITVTNTWQHFAFVRNGNVLTGYVNGQAFLTKSMAGHTVYHSGAVLRVGGNTNNQWLNGYVDNLRITNGVARYTSDFSPYHERVATVSNDVYASSVVLGLHFNKVINSTNIIDVTAKTITASGAALSATQARFGPTSCRFVNAGDRITVPYTTDFDFGNGNFTIEMWVYKEANNPNTSRLWNSNGDYYHQVEIGINATGYLAVYMTSNGTSWNLISNASIALLNNNQWYHIAVVRNGGNALAFVDGIMYTLSTGLGTTTLVNGTNGATTRSIGGQALGTNRSLTGYIDDVRVTKGVARYTATFTPPVAPFK